jgi:4-amino-4-deoxy-L-arabinose transferase-like glycosyltransferase
MGWGSRSLNVATIVAAALIGLLSLNYFTPIPEDCFEWCGLNRIFANAGISLVVLAWLVWLLAIGWAVRHRTRRVAALSAALVAAVLVIQSLGALLLLEAFDSPILVFIYLLLVLSLGLQLPPAWALAAEAQHWVAGAAAIVVGLAAVGGWFAYVALGPSIFSEGLTLMDLAATVARGAFVVLALSCWQSEPRLRPGVIAVAIGFLVLVVGDLAIRLTQTSFYPLTLLGTLAMAAGWAWVAAALLRKDAVREEAVLESDAG